MPVPDLLTALRAGGSVIGAELRPPKAELAASDGMDAWIDTYHSVRQFADRGTFVFLTDSAVGQAEEDNLRHLVTNLGKDVPRERIVPFLTAKHSLEYCLSYAERAHQSGFPRWSFSAAINPRRAAVSRHAWQLRQMLRARSHDWSRRLGQPARRRASTGRISGLADVSCGVLSHPAYQPPRRPGRRTVPLRGEAARRDAPGDLQRFLLQKREPTDTLSAESVPACRLKRADGGLRGWRQCRRGLRRTIRTLLDAGAKAFLREQPAAGAGARRARPYWNASELFDVASAVGADRLARDEIAVEQREHRLGDFSSPPQRPGDRVFNGSLLLVAR